MFNFVRKPPADAKVVLPRARLLLYLVSFFSSVLSTLFVLLGVVLYGFQRESYYPLNDRLFPVRAPYFGHEFLLIMGVPLVWSAIWSSIVFRSVYKALKYSIFINATRDLPLPQMTGAELENDAPVPSSHNDWQSRETAQNPSNSRTLFSLSHDYSLRATRKRRNCCGCCTCPPFHSLARGGQPVTVLVVEILLLSSFFIVGILFLPRAVTVIFHSPISGAFDLSAAVFYVLSTLVHIALLVLACVTVHRWRDETGKRSSSSSQEVKRRKKLQVPKDQCELAHERELEQQQKYPVHHGAQEMPEGNQYRELPV